VFLTTVYGEYILDENYERIMLPENININREDLMLVPHSYPEPENPEESNLIRIGIYTFDNIYGLELIGGSKFMPTALSGEAEIMESPADNIIRQYYIEASNVNIADEMVRVIQAQRAFQSNLTVIRTADEIAAYVNQLNGQ
jgi:flagellar basal-body rod protein FlgG